MDKYIKENPISSFIYSFGIITSIIGAIFEHIHVSDEDTPIEEKVAFYLFLCGAVGMIGNIGIIMRKESKSEEDIRKKWDAVEEERKTDKKRWDDAGEKMRVDRERWNQVEIEVGKDRARWNQVEIEVGNDRKRWNQVAIEVGIDKKRWAGVKKQNDIDEKERIKAENSREMLKDHIQDMQIRTKEAEILNRKKSMTSEKWKEFQSFKILYICGKLSPDDYIVQLKRFFTHVPGSVDVSGFLGFFKK